MDILAQNPRRSEGVFKQKCNRCGRLVERLFSQRSLSGEVCGDCLWNSKSPKKASVAHGDGPAAANVRRVFRLVLCFGCNEYLSADRMSPCLVFCRPCLEHARREPAKRGNRFVEKALSRVAAFVRGRV